MSNELKSDEIFIDSLECFTVIGINDWEKKTKQLDGWKRLSGTFPK